MSVTYTPKLIVHRDNRHGNSGQYPVWEVKTSQETYYVERRVHPDLVPCGARSVAIAEDGSVVCSFDLVKPRSDGRNHRVESLPVSENFYMTKESFIARANGTYKGPNKYADEEYALEHADADHSAESLKAGLTV